MLTGAKYVLETELFTKPDVLIVSSTEPSVASATETEIPLLAAEAFLTTVAAMMMTTTRSAAMIAILRPFFLGRFFAGTRETSSKSGSFSDKAFVSAASGIDTVFSAERISGSVSGVCLCFI